MEKDIKEQLDRIEKYTLLAAKNVLTVEEACLMTGHKKSGIYYMTSHRQIPHYKRGTTLYFKRDELESWMTEKKIETQKELRHSEAYSTDFDALFSLH